MSKVRVMGLYGVAGIGKTTMCKILCNELDGEFNSKVHHVELPSGSEVGEFNRKVHHLQLLQKVLNALTNTSLEFAKSLNEDQVIIAIFFFAFSPCILEVYLKSEGLATLL